MRRISAGWSPRKGYRHSGTPSSTWWAGRYSGGCTGTPAAFNSYRPGRLEKGAYPLEACPNARTYGERVGAIRMTQHNTVAEANAAARAVTKVTEGLLGERE